MTFGLTFSARLIVSSADSMKISESHLILRERQQSHEGPDLCLFVWMEGDANLIARGLGAAPYVDAADGCCCWLGSADRGGACFWCGW